MKQHRTCDAVLNDNYGDSIVLCQKRYQFYYCFQKVIVDKNKWLILTHILNDRATLEKDEGKRIKKVLE